MVTGDGPETSQTTAPRRHGRRARQLTPEELAELEALRAEYERVHGPIDGGEGDGGTAEGGAADGGDVDGAHDPGNAEPVLDDMGGEPAHDATAPDADADAAVVESSLAEAPEVTEAQPAEDEAQSAVHGAEPAVPSAVQAIPEDPAVPSLRRFGRRARIVEVEDAPASDVDPNQPVITRDADGVELGEIPVGDAPDPRPAPRFEGRVLRRPERSGGNPMVWIVWGLVALAVIALVILLATGVLGGGSAHALEAPDAAVRLVASAFSPTQEVTLS